MLPADVPETDQAAVHRDPAILLLVLLLAVKVWQILQLSICQGESYISIGHLKLESKFSVKLCAFLEKPPKRNLDLYATEFMTQKH